MDTSFNYMAHKILIGAVLENGFSISYLSSHTLVGF